MMTYSLRYFAGIERAIAELGDPATIWFRGHCAENRLLPTLFRFPEGAENEDRIIERYCDHSRGLSKWNPSDPLAMLIDMHHSYVPTRLLAWTERLDIALFCALVRESDGSAVFVLNPIALNAQSNINGIEKADDAKCADHQAFAWLNRSSPAEHPIAVHRCFTERGGSMRDTNFTLHGRNRLPLEEQCSACVRKVILTDEEKSMARKRIVSGP